MYLILRCVLLIFAVSVCGAKNLGIIGGESANMKNFPYMISMNDSNGFSCGGSILDETTILTAAHCINLTLANSTYIRYGNAHVNQGHLIEVSKLIMHENFKMEPPFQYDIGLLKLKHPITFSKTAQPIKLPKTVERTPVNKTAVVSGWGTTNEETQSTPEVLQKVNLIVVSDQDCAARYNEIYPGVYINPLTQTCAGAREDGKGVCLGDSGGPLVIDGVQYGIVSLGRGCALKEYPAVFTRVSAYLDWIRHHK